MRQYYPLVHTGFWIEYHLWRFDPRGYHMVNIALHGLMAGMVWRVLRRLNVPGAWVGAAVFALHPIHVESIASVTERKNVLSGVFYVASLLACLRFYRINSDTVSRSAVPDDARQSWGWYAAALLLFVWALLSKTVVAVLPVVVLLILWWKHGRWSLRNVVPLIPFFASGIVMGLMTKFLEAAQVGAIGQDWQFTFLERCLIAGRAIWFYVGKLLWPYPLVFIYPRWGIDTSVGWQYLFPAAALLAGLVLVWLHKRFGRGLPAAAGIFAVSLAPASGLFDVYPMRFSFVADHFVYHASLAFIAAVIGLSAALIWRAGRGGRIAGFVLVPAVLFALGAATWARCADYADAETLWLQTHERNPGSMIVCFNLAHIRHLQGRDDEAHAYIQMAVEARPDHPLTYQSLSWIQEILGHRDDAMASLRRSISLYRGYEPERGVAHQRLANFLPRADGWRRRSNTTATS